MIDFIENETYLNVETNEQILVVTILAEDEETQILAVQTLDLHTDTMVDTIELTIDANNINDWVLKD